MFRYPFSRFPKISLFLCMSAVHRRQLTVHPPLRIVFANLSSMTFSFFSSWQFVCLLLSLSFSLSWSDHRALLKVCVCLFITTHFRREERVLSRSHTYTHTLSLSLSLFCFSWAPACLPAWRQDHHHYHHFLLFSFEKRRGRVTVRVAATNAAKLYLVTAPSLVLVVLPLLLLLYNNNFVFLFSRRRLSEDIICRRKRRKVSEWGDICQTMWPELLFWLSAMVVEESPVKRHKMYFCRSD